MGSCAVNLNQLKLFYLAVKHKSLTSAARELNVTQPAVTKGIQRLQDHYEVNLVLRAGKQLELTRAGRELYRIAEKIFELEKLADTCLQTHCRQRISHILLHAAESFGAYLLPGFVNRFKAACPSIRVTVEILTDDEVVSRTLGLQNDFGFVSTLVKNRKLAVHPLMADELVMIMPPDHPLAGKSTITDADLDGQAVIMHEQGSFFQKTIQRHLEQNSIKVEVPMTLSNNEAIKRAVAGGAGIAPISRRAAEPEIRSKALTARPLASSAFKRRFYLIHHRDKPVSGPLGHLRDIILAGE